MTTAEIRHLAIELLTAPTARDTQTKIGASNLSNGCDHCLASNLMGDTRETPQTSRAWLGAVLGTALHGVFEHRAKSLQFFRQRYPDAQIEVRRTLGTLGTYGEIGTTPDLVLGGDVDDWKSSTRKKTALLRDYLQSQGLDRIGQQPYGRTHAAVKLSEKEYAHEMLKQAYKVSGYYAQVQLYIKVCRNAGLPVTRGNLIFVNRDGTAWFDNPAATDYTNEARMQDVWALGFDWNEAYADAVWARGLRIWEALEAGAVPADFPSAEHCFPCGLDRAAEIREATKPEVEIATIGNQEVKEVAA
jgi:hypothetical protein